MKTKSINREINPKTVKQVVIDAGIHRLLKIRASEAGQSVKELLEGVLADYLAVKGDENGNN